MVMQKRIRNEYIVNERIEYLFSLKLAVHAHSNMCLEAVRHTFGRCSFSTAVATETSFAR